MARYTDNDRNALDTIRLIANYHFWLLKRLKGAGYSQVEFADEIGMVAKELNNFMTARSDAQVNTVVDKLRSEVTRPAYIKAAPDAIKRAIDQIYLTDSQKVAAGLIQEIFENIAHATDEQKESVGICYSGTWNTLRYAAHDIESGFKAIPQADGHDALIVRAAMVVSPYDPNTGDFPAFEIHYRPGMARNMAPIKRTRGCVVPHRAGPHLLFFGAEEDSGYPLSITTQRMLSPQINFRGIVKRRIETNQQFMAARIAFFRTERSVADLNPLLGLHRESDVLASWKDEFVDLDNVLGGLENKIDYKGKSGLWL